MAKIEFLVLANHAEAKDGLLYLSGAGWTDLRRMRVPSEPPPVSHFGIAVSILVPSDEADRQHRIVVRVESGDGTELTSIQGDLGIRPPAWSLPGSEHRAVLAVNADLVLSIPGGYRVVAELDDDRRSVGFRVHDMLEASSAAG